MGRREFSKAIRAEIVRRATVDNVVRCEQCYCTPKTWHVDHTIPDALFLDKKRDLTAADGKVLCAGSADTCHGRKTPQDVKDIAKTKRVEAGHLRIETKSKVKIPQKPSAKSQRVSREVVARRADIFGRPIDDRYSVRSPSILSLPHPGTEGMER